MPARVSIDQTEFQAFIAENSKLMEKYRELLDRLTELTHLNQDLNRNMKAAEEKLKEYESLFAADVTQSDQVLRKARESMERLFEETKRVLSVEA